MDLNIPLEEEESDNGGFDLNMPILEDENENGGWLGDAPVLEHDDDADGLDMFNLNMPILEDENENGGWLGDAPVDAPVLEHDGDADDLNMFDLNLPLDEFGAVNFDFVENLTEHAMEGPVAAVQLPLDAVQAPVANNRRNQEMSNDLRKQVYQALLARSRNGTLGKKDTSIVAAHFGVHIQAVQRLWKRGKTQLASFIPVDVSSRKKGRCGRKELPLNLEALRDIPIKDRLTIEDVSSKLNMSKCQIQRLLKKGLIRHHSSTIKPYLTVANKKARLKWCVDMIDKDILDDPRFKDLFDIIFIDEKWFYLYPKSERCYLLPDEDDPHRTCKNKNYIPKIMFLCVCTRPRFRDGECIFDGKIGCFPLVTYEPAQRGNERTGRVRGDLMVKPIASITREVLRDFMINKVLPAIRAKWPREDVGKPIYIQQDNAPSHIKLDDPIFCEAAQQHGFDIRLICQPPNSPDLNVLDLGFFRAIQSIQYKKDAKTIEALIPVVQEAFMEYSPHKANKIFLTLQTVLMEVMKIRGCNNYKIPHMQKARLEREEQLPLQISCDPLLLAEAVGHLDA